MKLRLRVKGINVNLRGEVFVCNQEEKSVLCKHLIDDEIEELKRESLTSLGRAAEYNEKSNFLKEQSDAFSD